MRINSYAHAFPRNRRIYRIDRWTIPIPGGLPLKTSAWFVGIAVATIAIGQLPGVNEVANAIGWPATVLIGPGALSVAFTRPLVEGRTIPQHALCVTRWRITQLQSRRASHRDAAPVERLLTMACDHTMSTRVRIHGPGRIALDGALVATQRGANVITTKAAKTIGGAPYLIELAVGQVLEVGT